MTQPAEYVVIKKWRKARDVETHLRRVTVDGVVAMELRDYIPSADKYGRGYWLPPEFNIEIGQALVKEG